MSVRHFGIFLAYGPTVDLQKEGLGRLLSAFLKAAAAMEDVKFVIACPEWSKQGLLAFFESQDIPAEAFEILTTDGVPFFLRIYLALRLRRLRRRKPRFARLRARIRSWLPAMLRSVARRLVSARSVVPWLLIAVACVIFGGVLGPVGIVLWVLLGVWAALAAGAHLFRRLLKSGRIGAVGKWLAAEFNLQSGESLDVSLYRLMEEAEVERMLPKINALRYVKAWYSPTAFWPGFNRIAAPRLLCVPDVLPVEFPVGFAQLEPELLKNFETVERTVRGGEHFVTYSSRVKWDTLVDRYSASPDAVSVIPHASWDLSPWLSIRGFPNQEQATRRYCERQLQHAFSRTKSPYLQGLAVALPGGALKFLFYPSQFRPNKNLLTLLRAYEYLVRQRFIPHKLILTGDPKRSPAVEDFIKDHHLERDILCLHGLTTPELAAFYHLADLAVNPSLSEGGFPFTLTEAISVDTPAVMARIPVTEEVVEDPALQAMMLFDPYNWQDAAARIEWALEHRESLLHAQRQFCARLGQRTWHDVVGDYVSVLDRLSADAPVGQAEAGWK
jgi:hypothetical protein